MLHLSPDVIAGAERALQARGRGADYPTLDAIMQAALAGDTARLGGGSVFVYREGETNPGGNVFASFEEARSVAALVKPSSVLIDASLGAPRLPAGSYDIDMISIIGGTGAIPNLTIEDGASFTGVALSFDNVALTSISTSPAFEFNDGQGHFITLNNSAVMQASAPAAGPMAHVGSTSSLFVSLRYFGFLFSYAVVAPIVDVDLGGSTFIFTDIATAIFDNVLSGAGAILVDDLTGIAVANRNPNLSHVQLGTNITYAFG